MHRQTIIAVFVLVALAGAQSLAQHPPTDGTAPSTDLRFSFVQYGAFQHMMHTKDFSAKARLDEVAARGVTDAVGAVSDLRGEVTIVDGKIILSYGTPCAQCVAPSTERATLLSTAKVVGWQAPIDIPQDLSGPALDAFIVARGKAAGLDMDKPFPIRVEGTLHEVIMHVLKGAKATHGGSQSSPTQGGGHQVGHGHGNAEQEIIRADRLDGLIVGFYAPPGLQGIATHPGEPFHYHWVDVARTRTTHLDAFGVGKGARLLLPKVQ